MATAGGFRLVSSVIKRLNSGIQGFPVCSFVLLTYLWSWGSWLLLRLNPSLPPHGRAWTCLYVAGLCGPMAAAILTLLIQGGMSGIGTLVRQFHVPNASVATYALAILLAPMLWIAAEKAGHGESSLLQPPLLMLIVAAKMLVRGGPLTEETGWRGFLLPTLLKRMSLFWASLVILPIWALWHLPLWFLPGLPHHEWSFLQFLLMLAPFTMVFSWLYVKGECKVWLPILFHTSINCSLNFSSVVPSRTNLHAGFPILLAFIWAVTAVLILADRELWFAFSPAQESIAPATRVDQLLTSQRECVS